MIKMLQRARVGISISAAIAQAVTDRIVDYVAFSLGEAEHCAGGAASQPCTSMRPHHEEDHAYCNYFMR